jgi:hypothetical protein
MSDVEHMVKAIMKIAKRVLADMDYIDIRRIEASADLATVTFYDIDADVDLVTCSIKSIHEGEDLNHYDWEDAVQRARINKVVSLVQVSKTYR